MMYNGLKRDGKLLTVFIIGVFLSYVQASDNCNISYRPCEFHPGGVYDLDCFSRREVAGTRAWRCEWTTENSTSIKLYSLYIKQDTYCTQYENLTEKSGKIQIFERKDLTALVVDKNCTKAIFMGSPKALFRCGPPHKVAFYHDYGTLNVNVDWLPQEKRVIQGYTVRYKAQGDLLWKESSLTNQTSKVDRLNPNLTYVAGIKCDVNNKCSQCPWSHTYTIPQELRMQPVLTSMKEVDNTETKGTRLISLTWKIAAKERPDGYRVTIRKASGEPPSEHLNTTDTEITLNLSCSAYTVNISAFNNASVSPALTVTIQRCEDIIDAEDGKLNITVHSSTSFTVYWRLHLLKDYVCYSVEWSEKQQKATYMSFFENAQSYRQLDLPEPLKRYKRYSLYLHTRPNKETCNMKHINNGERTYASTHFYYMEGTPISAPTNISCLNMTSSSVVLQWSPIPEDDLRGFLLGYIIFYKKYNRGAQTGEKNLTVDAEFTSCELEDLKTGTGYQVQISGFTRAGVGDRSITSFFKTYDQENWKDHVIIIIFVATSSIMIIVASPLLKRTKVILWPSIPNPENSSAIRKIEKCCETELIKTMTVEEWDSNSLQIIEESDALRLPILFTTEERADSLDTAPGWTQDNMNNPTDREQKGLAESQTALNCGYTTMEVFQQSLMPQCVPAEDMDDTKTELDDLVVTKPGLEYVGQFFSSQTFDMSTNCF